MLKLNGKFTETEVNEKDSEGAYRIPRITVAGSEYAIPPLAPRQNRRIIPRMSRLGEIDFNKLDEASIDDLYLIIYWALTRAYDIEEGAFMDMNIPLTELMPALTVITEQTGLAKLRKPGEEPSGEAPATGMKSTGTAPSPESVPEQDGIGTESTIRPSSDSEPSSSIGEKRLQ